MACMSKQARATSGGGVLAVRGRIGLEEGGCELIAQRESITLLELYDLSSSSKIDSCQSAVDVDGRPPRTCQ